MPRVRILASAGRLGLAVGIAALLGGLGAALWWSDGHRCVLPDGSTVQVLGAARGGTTFTTDGRWQPVARRILPAPLQRWMPTAYSANCGYGSNTITVYLRVIDRSGAPVGVRPWDFYAAEDETGFQTDAGSGGCTSGTGEMGLPMQVFPRRQKAFRLNFLDRDGRVLGSVRVDNPVFANPPRWTSEPLPQVRTNGPVAVTLRGLRESSGDRWWRGVVPTLEVRPLEPAWQSATAQYPVFLDAGGNEGRWLSRREPAWRLRVLVVRTNAVDFRPEEQVELPAMNVPASGEFVGVDRTFDRLGVQLIVHGVGGAGRLYVTNGVDRVMGVLTERRDMGHWTSSGSRGRVESWGSDLPFVLFTTYGATSSDEVRVWITDDRGRVATPDDHHGRHGVADGWTVRHRFSPADGARSVRIVLQVNRALVFEFPVSPRDVAGGESRR